MRTMTASELAGRYGRHPATIRAWYAKGYIEPINAEVKMGSTCSLCGHHKAGSRIARLFDVDATDAALAALGVYPHWHPQHTMSNAARGRQFAVSA